MFLVIENNGIAPVESFTMLGLSSARGKADKIGQFGSGAKHGILTAIRHKLNPRIYLGLEELAFYTESGKMGDKAYDKLCYMFRDKCESTSMVLEFGSLDWNGLDMALREFVSNAIDAADGDMSQLSVRLAETVAPIADKTVVAFECTPNVSKFYNELPQRFLHFSEHSAANGIIDKIEPNTKGRVYRKGVFVRETAYLSVFDYNFDDSVKIDESRNMSDYAILADVGRLWKNANTDRLRSMFRQISYLDNEAKTSYLESHIGSYDMIREWADDSPKKTWHDAFVAEYGENVVIARGNNQVSAMAQKRGKTVVVVKSEGWFNALKYCGIQTATEAVKDVCDDKGRKVKAAPNSLIVRIVKIWNKLDELGLTNGKTMPTIKSFVPLMVGESETQGYYKDGTIYIGEGYHSNVQIIIEELAHHITGASDNSRDFQDYAFKLAATLMTRKRKKRKD